VLGYIRGEIEGKMEEQWGEGGGGGGRGWDSMNNVCRPPSQTGLITNAVIFCILSMIHII
jgi:hypothetical protein